MTEDVTALRSRFERAVAEAGGTHDSEAVFAALAARYCESHRHYHTLAHVSACLSWLDTFRPLAARPAEVELALWFHDVVYVPGRGDNERRSAAFARTQLAALGVEGSVAARIAGDIEATEHHRAAGGDAALVVDLDLTILGSSPAAFDLFEQQIRREYGHVPEVLYRVGRRRVLRQFLSRSQIFALPEIRRRLEAAARANFRRKVGEL